MHHDKNVPSPVLVEEYRRQMMAMQRLATVAAPPPETPENSLDENWLDTRFPEPNIAKDKAAITTADTPAVSPPPIAESPFIGYVRIFAFTANEAEPIEGAQVTVGREGILYGNATTDRDGYTPVFPLPTVDPALTLQPGGPQPYIPYTIQVTAAGFRPVIHENVPIYGNHYATQSVALLPLLPGADPNQRQDFVSGGPANL